MKEWDDQTRRENIKDNPILILLYCLYLIDMYCSLFLSLWMYVRLVLI